MNANETRIQRPNQMEEAPATRPGAAKRRKRP